VYNTQNYLVFGLFPSSVILETRKNDISETGSVSVLRWRGEKIPTHLGPLERVNLNHDWNYHFWMFLTKLHHCFNTLDIIHLLCLYEKKNVSVTSSVSVFRQMDPLKGARFSHLTSGCDQIFHTVPSTEPLLLFRLLQFNKNPGWWITFKELKVTINRV
jgi:hypothetical protein